jgi:hypothetical protein
MFRAAKWARNLIALSLTRRPAIIALAAVMLLFRGTETSDDREFTVYKKERRNPPVGQNRAKHPYNSAYYRHHDRSPIYRAGTAMSRRITRQLP